jgi:hypothetical protein
MTWVSNLWPTVASQGRIMQLGIPLIVIYTHAACEPTHNNVFAIKRLDAEGLKPSKLPILIVPFDDFMSFSLSLCFTY